MLFTKNFTKASAVEIKLAEYIHLLSQNQFFGCFVWQVVDYSCI